MTELRCGVTTFRQKRKKLSAIPIHAQPQLDYCISISRCKNLFVSLFTWRNRTLWLYQRQPSPFDAHIHTDHIFIYMRTSSVLAKINYFHKFIFYFIRLKEDVTANNKLKRWKKNFNNLLENRKRRYNAKDL